VGGSSVLAGVDRGNLSSGGVHARFMRAVPRGVRLAAAADLAGTEDNGVSSRGCLSYCKQETIGSSDFLFTTHAGNACTTANTNWLVNFSIRQCRLVRNQLHSCGKSIYCAKLPSQFPQSQFLVKMKYKLKNCYSDCHQRSPLSICSEEITKDRKKG
jgi:hypothetical protein